MANYYQHKPDLNNVAEYTVSGTPSGSMQTPGLNNFSGGVVIPTLVKFSSVTRWIRILNTGNAAVRVGFSEAGVRSGLGGGVPGNYLVVESGERTPVLDLKLAEIWFLRDQDINQDGKSFGVAAGLTSIPRDSIINNWSGSEGVG